MIADRLSGQRIAVTGATGFVGTALVERLLRAVPGCEVVVLVRNGRRTSAADRVRKEILKSQAAYEVNVVAMSDRIWCGKCKKNKVTYYEQQTRSADESCTIFYQCLNCGHRWKN